MAASEQTENYNFPFPDPTDIVDVAGDLRLLAVSLDENIDEIIQDVVSVMISGDPEVSGIDAEYDDVAGKVNLSLDVNYVQDEVATLFTHNDHTNITATYTDDGTYGNRIILTATGGGSGSSSGSSLTDAWWLGV
jgi:predicted glycosyltransferase